VTRRRARGYTAVELLMAISIFAIGVAGIIAMQKVMVNANQHAKNLSIATHIAQATLDQLATDAVTWNHPSPSNMTSDLDAETAWLGNVNANPNVWIRPAYNATRAFGAGFDALGDPLPDTASADAVFCTHVRFSWLYPQTAGNGLIRAEVRVFWLREGMGGTANGQPLCDPSTDPALIENSGDRYHFVYQATAIKENTAS
jgi:prepilin-type N-terminal cleavage/methylation domain-containing protein